MRYLLTVGTPVLAIICIAVLIAVPCVSAGEQDAQVKDAKSKAASADAAEENKLVDLLERVLDDKDIENLAGQTEKRGETNIDAANQGNEKQQPAGSDPDAEVLEAVRELSQMENQVEAPDNAEEPDQEVDAAERDIPDPGLEDNIDEEAAMAVDERSGLEDNIDEEAATAVDERSGLENNIDEEAAMAVDERSAVDMEERGEGGDGSEEGGDNGGEGGNDSKDDDKRALDERALPRNCIDRSFLCRYVRGCCSIQTVKVNCKKTCGYPGCGCSDHSSVCKRNPSLYCRYASNYNYNCRYTCHRCRSICKDKYTSSTCNQYKRTGRCGYVNARLYCKKTCNNCNGRGCSDRSSACKRSPSTYCRSAIFYNTYCRYTCHRCRSTCKDTISTLTCSAYKRRGLCNYNRLVRSRCKKTCNNCNGKLPYTPPCRDSSSRWTSICGKNKPYYCQYHNYYNTYCKKTCSRFGRCRTPCKDASRSCATYKRRGYCKPTYSRHTTYLNWCKKTCNNCDGLGSCRDTWSSCASRIRTNRSFCSTSSGKYYCKRTCRLCYLRG